MLAVPSHYSNAPKPNNSIVGAARAALKADQTGNLVLDFSGGARPKPQVFDYFPPRAPGYQVRPFADIDFETFYTQRYSVQMISNWEYVNHVAFDAHTVAVAIVRYPNDITQPWKIWVGHPIDFPWHEIGDLEWISHNTSFDELVYRRLQSLGITPKEVNPPVWNCSADLSSYLQEGRALADAALNLLGMSMDKTVRDQLKGGGHGLTTEAILDYAGKDSIGSGLLWLYFSVWWPEWERVLSRLTRYAGWRGVGINVGKCNADILHLNKRREFLIKTLPWGGKRANSIQAVQAQCAKEGIMAPPKLSLDDEGTIKWVEKYGHSFPWVGTIRDITKVNQTVNALKTCLYHVRKNGTAPFDLTYMGAPHTGRWKNGSALRGKVKKMRMHNLDKEPVEGVHVRNELVAGPGFKFIIADLSQIEPRVLNWWIGNEIFLQACREGQSPYEAHARASMAYTAPGRLKKVDPLLYALAKARVLALGYQAGPDRFIEMALQYAGLKLELDQAIYLAADGDRILEDRWDSLYDTGRLNELLHPADHYKRIPSSMDSVKDFRQSNPDIVRKWYSLDGELKQSVGGNYFNYLPSGRVIRYFGIRRVGEEIWGDLIHNTKNPKQTRSLYGGLLTENWVQACARDVLGYVLSTIDINFPWIRNVWHVHDEGIWRVQESRAEEALKIILDVMHSTPPWAPGLPIAAEGGIHDYYLK